MDVPKELKELPQWMLWREEYGTKVPYQINGLRAKTNDASTFCEFSEAVVRSKNIAFVICETDPYTGIDLDDCYDGKSFLPWAQEILDKFRGVSYAEISPSGTGVKMLVKAKKPPGSKCSFKDKLSSVAVECYDRVRFWCMTGNCIGGLYRNIGSGQKQVDWLCEKYLSGDERKTSEKHAAAAGGSFELLARAEAYIDACEPGVKGGLRNAAFRNAGHLHAMIGSDGARLSDTDVYNLLKRWNLRNSTQLRDDELREAAVNGRKNGTPPADKPPEIRIVPDDSDVDLSGILDQVVSSPPSDVPFSPGDFPRDAIPTEGILAQIIEYNLATAMFPQPELAFSGALALMSVLTGRKVETEYKTRTNLYILGIGESGTGKEHARKVNKELLYACEAESMVGPERLGSSAGLTTALTERLACLYQIDEIGHMLATMKNPGKAAHLFNIATVLMQLYSSADSVWIGDAYADSKKTPTIIQPHAVVYGTATPQSFWGNLTADAVQNGLLGRMLAFECPGYVDRVKPQRINPPDNLVHKLSVWRNFHPGGIDKSRPIPLVVSHSPEAAKRQEDHLDGIHERRKDELPEHRAVWSRTGEKTAKLALIFACCRQMPPDIRIEIEDVDRAIKITNWLTRRMLRQAYDYVSENQIEDNKKRVLRKIGSGEIERTQLQRRTQWLKARERTEILIELQDAGIIEIITAETKGRPKTIIRRVG